MKRMIDGIINYSVTNGGCTSNVDTEVSVDFYFPLGYWPISLCSKPFSIIPGRLTATGDDVSDLCSNSQFPYTLQFLAVSALAACADAADSGRVYS